MPKTRPKPGRPSLGKEKRVRLSMTLKPSLVARLDKRASATGVSYSRLVEELLEEGLRSQTLKQDIRSKSVHLERREKVLLRDIRRTALEVKSFVTTMTEAIYLKDLRTQRATERGLRIIGEASKGLSEELREAFPGLPFHSIISLSDFLGHAFSTVQPVWVWETAKKDIPALLQALDSGPKFQ